MPDAMEKTVKLRAELQVRVRNYEIDKEANLETIWHEKNSRKRIELNRANLSVQGFTDRAIKGMVERVEGRIRTCTDLVSRIDELIKAGQAELSALDHRIKTMEDNGIVRKPLPKSTDGKPSQDDLVFWQGEHDARPTKRQDRANNIRPARITNRM